MSQSSTYRYINNNKKESILFLHGFACSGIYFDQLVSAMGNDYNYIISDLPGHGNNPVSYTLSLDSVAGEIAEVITGSGFSITCIVAHSMASILAFELQAKMNDCSIILLSGNLIEKDFEWSSHMSGLSAKEMQEYWERYQKTYKTFLRLSLVVKPDDFNPYVVDIMKTLPGDMSVWARMIASKRSGMQEYSSCFSSTLLIEASTVPYLEEKVLFCKENDIEYHVMEGVSHYLLIEEPQGIARIIKETLKP